MRSEMTVTTVNPGWFADNYMMVLDMAAHLGLFTMPLRAGDVKRNAAPSNEDIAQVVTAALVDPATHAGQTYRPTGPELLSPNAVAAAMGRALRRRVRYVDISERMMVKALQALPRKNYSVAAVTQLALYAEEYRRGTFAINAPTDHVARIGGQTPQSLEDIVRDRVVGRPDLTRSAGRSLRAMAGFAKILATRPFDLRRAEDARDYDRLADPKFSQDDPCWSATHVPDRLAITPIHAA